VEPGRCFSLKNCPFNKEFPPLAGVFLFPLPPSAANTPLRIIRHLPFSTNIFPINFPPLPHPQSYPRPSPTSSTPPYFFSFLKIFSPLLNHEFTRYFPLLVPKMSLTTLISPSAIEADRCYFVHSPDSACPLPPPKISCLLSVIEFSLLWGVHRIAFRNSFTPWDRDSPFRQRLLCQIPLSHFDS